MENRYIELHTVMSRRGDVGIKIYLVKGTKYYKYRPIQVWENKKTNQSWETFFIDLNNYSSGLDSVIQRALKWVDEHDPAAHKMLSAWSDGAD